MELNNKELIIGIFILLFVGALVGYLWQEQKTPSYEGLTKDYFKTARGCFISGNVVCYDYTPHEGVNTQGEEEIHMLINTNSDKCEGGSCFDHFCGDK